MATFDDTTPNPITSAPIAAARIASTERDALALRSPDALVSSLPYLIGFAPRSSIVLLWIIGGRLVLTQRMDLPLGAPSEDFMTVMWGHEAAARAEEIIACLVTEDEPNEDLVTAVLERAASRDVHVRDVLAVDEGRWRSLLCEDWSCCPLGGRAVDPSVQAEVAAEFAVMGVAPAARREDVESETAHDARRAEAVAPHLVDARARLAHGDREEWRDGAAERLTTLLTRETGPSSPQEMADLIVGLTDVRVRDTVLWECARLDGEGMRRAQATLREATRCAPSELVAAVATCGAILAWMLGDGARALISVERALGADAGYSLGHLVLAALQGGLPPNVWREAMASLSRDDCRVPRHAA